MYRLQQPVTIFLNSFSCYNPDGSVLNSKFSFAKMDPRLTAVLTFTCFIVIILCVIYLWCRKPKNLAKAGDRETDNRHCLVANRRCQKNATLECEVIPGLHKDDFSPSGLSLEFGNCNNDGYSHSLNTPLLISVDATPNVISGYCVDFRNRVCKFYSFGSWRLPWILKNRKDSNEFEMKNLVFALVLWEEEIKEAGKFLVYTDNDSVNKANCPYGSTVSGFLQHLTGCKDLIIVNSNTHLHSGRDAARFQKFIQPADDLSRWNLHSFSESIVQNYGILDFQGTHRIVVIADF